LIGVIAMAIISVVAISSSKTGNAVNLPYYATSNPTVKQAYEFAFKNPDALDGVNCHCGCMENVHNGRVHKRGLRDCFMTEDGGFEQHASQCDMCIQDTLEVKSMIQSGIAKEQIKQTIDSKYIR